MSFTRAFTTGERVPNVTGMHQIPAHLVVVLAVAVVGVGYWLWTRSRDRPGKGER